MEISEIIFVLLLVGGFLLPTALTGQWWLFAVFAIFFVIFGLVEWLAVSRTKRSVSQHFWKYSEEHKTGATIVLIGMLLGWLTLLYHLGSRFLF